MKLEMPSYHPSDSTAKKIHFFKIILSDADAQTKLMIPRKFVWKYGKYLDSRVSLKTPNGLVWQVNLKSHKDEVWLQDGWPDFARFYCIQFGHFLVFKYRGPCEFKVRIFDPSFVEIEYPSSSITKPCIGESSQVKKRAIEIDHSTCSDLIRPRKKRAKKLALKAKFGDRGSAIKESEARALALAQAFKSNNPVFSCIMRISHLDGKHRGLVVKKAFEENYRSWKDNDQVHLQVGGKTWLVNCDMKCNRCRLSIGWERFAHDNSLTLGDVCIFELINACRKLLQVVIFRAPKETNGDGGSAIEESNSKVLELALAKDFKSPNSFFVLAMKQSHVDGKGRGMVVRKTFEKTYKMWKNNDHVILQFAGKTWLVYCDIYGNGGNCCRLRRGWDIFVKDNILSEGDICIFELIDASKKLLQVFIFQAAKKADSNVNRQLESKVEIDKALACAKAFKSENPFFILPVKPYILSGSKGRPCVPSTFKEAYKNWKHNDQIILQVAGRTSPVCCTLRLHRRRYRISPGWGVFARDNTLNAGDVCVFELINPSRKLFNVSIFRASDEAEKTGVLTTSEAVTL